MHTSNIWQLGCIGWSTSSKTHLMPFRAFEGQERRKKERKKRPYDKETRWRKLRELKTVSFFFIYVSALRPQSVRIPAYSEERKQKEPDGNTRMCSLKRKTQKQKLKRKKERFIGNKGKMWRDPSRNKLSEKSQKSQQQQKKKACVRCFLDALSFSLSFFFSP